MEIQPTWHPYHGAADTTRSDLPDSVFAFPKERAEPLTDAVHVRSALARFGQVSGVSDHERDMTFANIKTAAEFYGVSVREKNSHELAAGPEQIDMEECMSSSIQSALTVEYLP